MSPATLAPSTAPAPRSRSAHALRAGTVHLLLSATVAGLVALLVFGAWFPGQLRALTGGAELFWLLVGVDVVCGPLLTLVVFNPAKPRTELRRDLALVVLIQLLALGYGVHSLSYARPVALVYEVDRFRSVSFADLDEAENDQVPDWAQPWGLSPPRTVGIRKAASSDEMMSSVDASLQGVEPSQRPSWWQDYALSVPQVLQRARPLAELRRKHPQQSPLIDSAAAQAIAAPETGETADSNALRWVPMVSRHATDWVVLLDPVTGRLRGYVHLDGF